MQADVTSSGAEIANPAGPMPAGGILPAPRPGAIARAKAEPRQIKPLPFGLERL